MSNAKSLRKHSVSQQHYESMAEMEKQQTKENACLHLKADICQLLQRHYLPAVLFEEILLLFYKEKKRSKCQCKDICVIGHYQQGSGIARSYEKISNEYYDKMIKKATISRKITSFDLVLIGGSMDGWSTGSAKCEVLGLLTDDEYSQKCYLLKLSSYDYGPEKERRVKDTKSCVKMFFNACDELDLKPSLIENEMDLYNKQPKIIFRNFATDDPYRKQIDVVTGEPVLDTCVKTIIPITPFFEPSVWDPQHLREISFSDAEKENDIITSSNKLLKAGVKTLKQPKMFKINFNLEKKLSETKLLSLVVLECICFVCICVRVCVFIIFVRLLVCRRFTSLFCFCFVCICVRVCVFIIFVRLLVCRRFTFLFCFCFVCTETEYLGFSTTRFNTYFHAAINRLLRHVKPTARMVALIPDFASNQVLKKTQAWRVYFGSIDYILYLVLSADHGREISDEITLINQRVMHRFNGQYSYYYLKEYNNLKECIANLNGMADMIDDIIYLQFSHQNIESIIDENNELFVLNPLLKAKLAAIIEFKYEGIKFTQLEDIFDLDCSDGDYEPEEDAMVEIVQENINDDESKEDVEDDANGKQNELKNDLDNEMESDDDFDVGDDYELKDNLSIGTVVAALRSKAKEAEEAKSEVIGVRTRAQAAQEQLENINNDNNDNINNISIEMEENGSHYIGPCDEATCEGYWVQCHCGNWCCDTHIKEKIVQISQKRQEPIELDLDMAVTPKTMDALTFFCCWNCNEYLSDIIRNFADYLDTFLKFHYSEEYGRNKVSEIKNSSDYAWTMVAVDRLIDLYLSYECDDAKWKLKMKDAAWMREDMNLFMELVKNWREKCKDSIYAVLIPNNDIEIQAQLIKLKLEIMQFIMDYKHLIEKKQDLKHSKRVKQLKKFRALLWRKLQHLIKTQLTHLTLIYELEQKKAYCECVIESLCSHIKEAVDASKNRNSDWDGVTGKVKNKIFQPKKWKGQEIHRQPL